MTKSEQIRKIFENEIVAHYFTNNAQIQTTMIELIEKEIESVHVCGKDARARNISWFENKEYNEITYQVASDESGMFIKSWN